MYLIQKYELASISLPLSSSGNVAGLNSRQMHSAGGDLRGFLRVYVRRWLREIGFVMLLEIRICYGHEIGFVVPVEITTT